ncbi:carboxy terminal-processing peptidase [Arenicella xantha]|uniref:S41A family C-terminal processing peptidase-1 n=1 Tax=Arenicella xantha TaxID=644221 RepID=A0A395JNR4_9GAMM|nr:carboxy terminal-processing peptidase [Arenicella xantha]RBP53300.1 S41A family C-terminal processing peptidase-1 [Arenicella xantha]
MKKELMRNKLFTHLSRTTAFVSIMSIAVIGLLGSSPAIADVQEVADSELTMTKDLSFDIHKTLYFLQFGHYSPKSLDDDYSARIFEDYLKTLDPNKVYFTQQDIDTFEPYRFKLDDLLKRRDAEVAFEIFKVFRKRLQDRTDKIMQLIDSEFDFTAHDALNIDRDTYTWAEDSKEIDSRWEKRIKNDTLQQVMAKTPIEEVRDNLKRRYQRQRDVIYQLKADEVFEWFMNSFTRDHGPHTTYMSHVTAENFDISMSLQLTGIGAALSTDEDYTVINRIIKGGPAEKSGAIKAEDKIIAVGQEGEEMINVIGWRLMDVVQMIRGDKGTKVRLDVLAGDKAPGSPPERLELVRDLIQLEDQAAKLTEVTIPEGNREHTYSVISVPSFYSNADQVARGGGKLVATTNDVENLIKEVKKSDSEGLILDLRGNGGGYLNEAVSLTGLFIERGPVVQVVGSQPGQRRVHRDTDSRVAYDGPMIVLIDRYSASASEIFAGALQDYGRALIVGERSFGKGTVQYPRALRDRNTDRKSKIKFTNAQFFRISGSSTQHRGVVPDLLLNSGEEDIEFGERSYDNALPWSQTEPADYTAGSFSPTLLETLKAKHLRRTDNSPAFDLLRKNSSRILENKKIKELSLNLEERQIRRDQQEKDSLDNLNAYRASLGLEPVTEETRKDNPLPGEDEHWNTVIHTEAAHIMHDFNQSNKAVITQVDAAPKH